MSKGTINETQWSSYKTDSNIMAYVERVTNPNVTTQIRQAVNDHITLRWYRLEGLFAADLHKITTITI